MQMSSFTSLRLLLVASSAWGGISTGRKGGLFSSTRDATSYTYLQFIGSSWPTAKHWPDHDDCSARIQKSWHATSRPTVLHCVTFRANSNFEFWNHGNRSVPGSRPHCCCKSIQPVPAWVEEPVSSFPNLFFFYLVTWVIAYCSTFSDNTLLLNKKLLKAYARLRGCGKLLFLQKVDNAIIAKAFAHHLEKI